MRIRCNGPERIAEVRHHGGARRFRPRFSSITYLRKLPINRIKIDQSLIHDMPVQPDRAAIVKSVISLARDLRIGVVAERVETADQLELLRQSQYAS